MTLEARLEHYFDRLWPICRSITGDGLRESFSILQEVIPFELTEVPSGTEVFDWVVPDEWNIRDAYILTPDGRKIADFKVNNLHVVNYATPVNKKCSFEELDAHLFHLEAQPEVIPYVTSYYRDNWGFCLSYNEYLSLPREGQYTVVIDSEKKPGSLTYGQCVLRGNSDEEILLSSYLCHPSMANNELSGPLALAFIYDEIKGWKDRRYTYRFVLAPETIGIIAFLHQHGSAVAQHIRSGFVMTCCGDRGPLNYKRSKRADALPDRIVEHLMQFGERPLSMRPFSVGGSDERQYCSPGFNFPVGSIMRTPYKEFKEYHTSGDNKDFISFAHLADTVRFTAEVLQAHELNQSYRGEVQYCEAMLGKRDLYAGTGAWMTDPTFRHDLLTILSYADGQTELLKVAEVRKKPINKLREQVAALIEKNLIS